MAAPLSKTLKDLSGKWVMNKTLSTNPEPALALQGIGFLTRKAIGLATVTLHVKQYTGPPNPPADAAGAPVVHIDIDQTATGGIKGTSERRCLDNEQREHSDWMFGHVVAQNRWVVPGDIEDAYLAKGWLETDDEKSGPNGETHIFNFVKSLDNEWTATQVWGFQTIEGERRYVRNVVVAKGDERVEVTLVYDYVE